MLDPDPIDLLLQGALDDLAKSAALVTTAEGKITQARAMLVAQPEPEPPPVIEPEPPPVYPEPKPPAGKLPEDPEAKRTSYDGPEYFVAPGTTGGPSTSEGKPGGFEQTIEGVNDGARIVLLPGSYPPFTARPKSGQHGRVRVTSKYPLFNGIDLAYDGGPTGWNESVGQHSVLTGKTNFCRFKGLWLEGLRCGPGSLSKTDTGTTNGSIWLYEDGDAAAVNWITKCFFKNCKSKGILIGDKMKACVYQNYFMGTEEIQNDRGGYDAAMDYPLFVDDGHVVEIWAVENFVRGLYNQGMSLKTEVLKAFFINNTFDSTIKHKAPDGTVATGGSAIFLGQSSDKPGDPDHTIGYAEVSGNRFRRLDGVVNIHLSNIAVADCHHNEHLVTEGILAAYRFYTGSNEPASVVAAHPKLWQIHHETFRSPSALRFQFGKTRVKESVQRHDIKIHDNVASAVVRGDWIGNADQNFLANSATRPDLDNNARMRVTFGPDARVSVPAHGGGLEVITR